MTRHWQLQCPPPSLAITALVSPAAQYLVMLLATLAIPTVPPLHLSIPRRTHIVLTEWRMSLPVAAKWCRNIRLASFSNT
ncbi:hypothetical protein D9613_011617 [Agrocybe pediades]|uniref:Uncharacterized protein n=1 Tax=Agrocybe pediades TaxID=84607 RepID=A0A8H4QWK0_9AGAR|nr:hypothetical protein D9613_011617 [Agrocybe pediades]